MTTREWLLSVAIVAFVALKVAEGFLALESWPLSHVPMFADRQPVSDRPSVFSVFGLRRGQWFEIHPWMLGLNRAELNRQIIAEADPSVRCSALIRSFNEKRPPRLHVEAAYVRLVTLARPGTDQTDIERRVECPLAAAQALTEASE